MGIEAVGPTGSDDSVGNTMITGTGISPYDCCVSCQTYPGGCGGFMYLGGSCNLVTYSTCSPTNMGEEFIPDEWGTIIVGNGPCGQIVHGGESMPPPDI